MRIDLVSEHASPLATLGGVDAGGQNVHVAALAMALARRGASVTVHTRRDDPNLPDTVPFAPGVRVHHVTAGPAGPVSKDALLPHMDVFADRLSACWSGDRPDVVHSHFWMSGLASLQAARPLGIPVAHTFHAVGSVKRRHQGAADTSPAERIDAEARLAREVDLVIATTSEEAFGWIVQGTDRGNIDVVPCGVDLHRFRPGVDPMPARGGRRRLVIVSRLVKRKGIGNVIAALADIPGTELVVAGGPPAAALTEDPEARRFTQLARHHGVGDRVHLLGALSPERVPALLCSADAVICCPWYEQFGMVALEAMACGVPVVASKVGGLAETVIDGVTGLHVPPRAPAAIAAATRQLLDDPELRQRLGRAAVHQARLYGWDRVARLTGTALARIATRAGAPALGAEPA